MFTSLSKGVMKDTDEQPEEGDAQSEGWEGPRGGGVNCLMWMFVSLEVPEPHTPGILWGLYPTGMMNHFQPISSQEKRN